MIPLTMGAVSGQGSGTLLPTIITGSATIGEPSRFIRIVSLDTPAMVDRGGGGITFVPANTILELIFTGAPQDVKIFKGSGRLRLSGSGLTGVKNIQDGLSGLCFYDAAVVRGSPSLQTVPTTLPASVVNLADMFRLASSFNDPNVCNWNTANVINMSNMFYNASQFNQPIGSWNTSNVTTLEGTFYGADAFNQPIGSWNTSNVTTLRNTFNYALAFNQPIGSWNTSNVTDMAGCFARAEQFNKPIGGWNTANVIDMGGMYFGAHSFNQNIGGWNTENVTSMTNMFLNAYAFNQDLSGWCVAAIPSKPGDFDTGATAWTLPKPVWGTCPSP